MEEKMIITIARECGSGGHIIANELASRFNFKVYDKEKLIDKAHEVGMFDELETFFADKKRRQPKVAGVFSRFFPEN